MVTHHGPNVGEIWVHDGVIIHVEKPLAMVWNDIEVVVDTP